MDNPKKWQICNVRNWAAFGSAKKVEILQRSYKSSGHPRQGKDGTCLQCQQVKGTPLRSLTCRVIILRLVDLTERNKGYVYDPHCDNRGCVPISLITHTQHTQNRECIHGR